MAETKTCLVEVATGRFIIDGRPESAGYQRVAMELPADHPNLRYDGNLGTRPLTAEERTADAERAAAEQTDRLGREFDAAKWLKAKAISDLAYRLGKAPGALTAAEIAAERSRVIAVYKALP